MNTTGKIATILTVTGAILFTLNGLGSFNLLAERTIGFDALKILVGLSAIYVLITSFFEEVVKK